jgi:multiple sugar transport system permease protein
MKLKSIVINSLLIILAIVIIYPIAWMLLLSLKVNPESYKSFSELIFSEYSIQNYKDAFTTDNFLLYLLNSFFIGTIVTLTNVLFCFITAYAIVRRDFLLKKPLEVSIYALLLVPAFVTMIPIYRLMVEFNWIDTYYALIVPFVINPFGIYLVVQYMSSIPFEIEDAARVDGASQIKILFEVIMPLCKPILTVLGIYTFLSNWNSFLYPYLLTNSEEIRTLPVGLAFYLGKQSIDWGNLMAGASISALPVIIVFGFFQKNIIQGLTAGAIKE